jgi:hypothetical protein
MYLFFIVNASGLRLTDSKGKKTRQVSQRLRWEAPQRIGSELLV